MIRLADGGDDDGPPDALDPVEPEAALAWFRDRVLVSRATWDRLVTAGAQSRAFTAAGVASLDVLVQVWRGIDQAIAQGTDFRTFQRAVGPALAEQWGRDDAPRVETIFRNNVQSAYAAGRYAVHSDPDVLAGRPYWQFDAILDGRTSTICRPLDGVVRLAADPFWKNHHPPLHHQCRSSVVSLDEDEAHAEPGLHTPTHDADPPQRGWGGTPDLGTWQPDVSAVPAPLRAAFVERNRAEAPARSRAPIVTDSEFPTYQRFDPAAAATAAERATERPKHTPALSPSDQARVRDQLRELIEPYGIPERTVPHRDSLRIVTRASLGGADGQTTADGTIELAEDHFRLGVRYLKRLRSGDTRPASAHQENAMCTWVHESLHQSSVVTTRATKRGGLAIEEAATELVARRIMRERFGAASEAVQIPNGGPAAPRLRAYDDEIVDLRNRLHAVLAAAAVAHAARTGSASVAPSLSDVEGLMENAALLHKQDGPLEYTSPEEVAHAFVGHLALPPHLDTFGLRNQLASAIIDPP